MGCIGGNFQPSFPPSRICSGLEPDLVVDCLAQPLLAPEVTFRRFHRDVAEEKLNLFQFAAGGMT